MASKKPALPLSRDRGFGDAVKELLERITGRRGSKVAKMTTLGSAAVTTTPTAAQHNALRADLDELRSRFNSLLDQIGDYD